jgi:hypothetical protein
MSQPSLSLDMILELCCKKPLESATHEKQYVIKIK